MATRHVTMTGGWDEIGTGEMTLSFAGSGRGRYQVQAPGASAGTLDPILGHPLGPEEKIKDDFGASAVYVKAAEGVILVVTD